MRVVFVFHDGFSAHAPDCPRTVGLDRVPVSVSEWLFGSFVLILFGDDEYFSCFNCHISKERMTGWESTGFGIVRGLGPIGQSVWLGGSSL